MILCSSGARKDKILFLVARRSKVLLQGIKTDFEVVFVEIVSIQIVIRGPPLDLERMVREV